MSNTTTSSGIGLSGAMFLLFLGLRLTGHIDWAWYWIAAPLWMPLGLVVGVVGIVVVVGIAGGIMDDIRIRRARARRPR